MNDVNYKHFGFWCCCINFFIACLICITYLSTVFPIELYNTTTLGKVLLTWFLLVSLWGHIGLIFFLPYILIWMPLAKLFKQYKLSIVILIIIFTILQLFLIADSRTYMLFRFHLTEDFLRVIFTRHVNTFFDFSGSETLIIAGFIAGIFLFQALLAIVIIKIKKFTLLKQSPKWISLSVGLSLFLSYFTLIFTAAHHVPVFAQHTRIFPYYNQVLAKILPIKNSMQTLNTLGYGRFNQLKQASGKFNYPTKPLQYNTVEKKYNILVIMIDTLRFDSIKTNLMPNITQYSKKSLIFNQHYSGGNATEAGLFSFFYSLPVSYWNASLSSKIGPVLFTRLKKLGYHFNIWASSQIIYPPFDKTIFQEVQSSIKDNFKGNNPGERDKSMTNAFIQKISSQKKPFFTYLLYDAVHGYCKQQDFSKPFQPAIQSCKRVIFNSKTNPIPYINRYRNALRYTDGQVARILKALKKYKLTKKTIVIITGDHGQEFNDNHQNYWEHASNFTRFQVQTPLIIYWPGKQHQIFSYQTSHYDIVPSLMNKLLGSRSPINQYSVGKSLFTAKSQPFLLIGSYANFGIIEPKKITVLYPTGSISVMTNHAKPLAPAKMHQEIIAKALHLMRHYYRDAK